MLPPNVCSSSGSVRRPCGGTAPPQKSVYGNNRTNRGVSPTNGAVWKAVRSGRLLLTADLVWKSWGRICLQTLRESRGGRKRISWPNSVLPPCCLYWLNWQLKGLAFLRAEICVGCINGVQWNWSILCCVSRCHDGLKLVLYCICDFNEYCILHSTKYLLLCAWWHCLPCTVLACSFRGELRKSSGFQLFTRCLYSPRSRNQMLSDTKVYHVTEAFRVEPCRLMSHS